MRSTNAAFVGLRANWDEGQAPDIVMRRWIRPHAPALFHEIFHVTFISRHRLELIDPYVAPRRVEQ